MAKILERHRIVSAQISLVAADRLEQLAADADRSLSAEIRRAIAAHLVAADREKSAE